MQNKLKISLGQHSSKGRKEINQDFFGAYVPDEPLLSTKGIVIALADGISSSDVSQIASQTTVASFLQDYYCTSEAWSVKKSAHQVLMATNYWLHAQTHASQYRYDKDRGYVCTLSALVLKSNTAHLFHVGDTRVYRLLENSLEQLTDDHRQHISAEQSYLSRAMGASLQLEVDYQSLTIEAGTVFLLATDGVYEHVDATLMVDAIKTHGDDLNAAAMHIVEHAYSQGSQDNLTVQLVRIETVPTPEAGEALYNITDLALPPILSARMKFDGYTIIRDLHSSSRSHVYLAIDDTSKQHVVIKIPSTDLRNDAAYLERFMMEDWIARRINSAQVLKASQQTRPRNYVYVATEYIDGQTLKQWLIDHPTPDMETVRGIVEQVAKGLLAFHRMEMLHQDLRPENIMIDKTGTAKIIDFGSTRVAGIMEMTSALEHNHQLGALQCMAPEYFLGEPGSECSDLYSLGVITYQMLSGRLPYGAEVPKARTREAQRRLVYESVLADDREIPAWIDDVLKKAVHPNPAKRYQEVSEFLYDLRHPSKAYLSRMRAPLLERNPVAFWKGVAFILAIVILYLLVSRRH
jgi:serine/threonine protein phosphatase PrpC